MVELIKLLKAGSIRSMTIDASEVALDTTVWMCQSTRPRREAIVSELVGKSARSSGPGEGSRVGVCDEAMFWCVASSVDDMTMSRLSIGICIRKNSPCKLYNMPTEASVWY